jgi:predicted phosphodiesterase
MASPRESGSVATPRRVAPYEGRVVERILIVPDTHAPYHDERAWRLMLRVARTFKPQTIVHQGDFADFYAVSSHSKDPGRAKTLKDELKVVKKLRGQLDRLGAKRKVFIEGNHEDRLRRYLEDKAPELFDLFDTDSLLQLSENGWEFVPYKQHTQIGKLRLTHDTGNSGKYTTTRALEAFQHSVVIGHHHQIQYQVEGDATGKYRVGAQFGWLGDVKQVDYMQRIKALRSWALGFGVGYRDEKTNLVYLTPVPIVNYTACVEGRIYRG